MKIVSTRSTPGSRIDFFRFAATVKSSTDSGFLVIGPDRTRQQTRSRRGNRNRATLEKHDLHDHGERFPLKRLQFQFQEATADRIRGHQPNSCCRNITSHPATLKVTKVHPVCKRKNPHRHGDGQPIVFSFFLRHATGGDRICKGVRYPAQTAGFVLNFASILSLQDESSLTSQRVSGLGIGFRKSEGLRNWTVAFRKSVGKRIALPTGRGKPRGPLQPWSSGWHTPCPGQSYKVRWNSESPWP